MSTAADYQRRAALAWEAWERIVQTDTSSWTEGARSQHQIETEKLLSQAQELDRMAATATSRSIFRPVTRANV